MRPYAPSEESAEVSATWPTTSVNRPITPKVVFYQSEKQELWG